MQTLFLETTLVNAIRFSVTIIIGVMFGVIFWNKGGQKKTRPELTNLLGATYAAILFLGASNASAVSSLYSGYGITRVLQLLGQFMAFLHPQFNDKKSLLHIPEQSSVPVNVLLKEGAMIMTYTYSACPSALAADDLARVSSRQMSRRSWGSMNVRGIWDARDVFQRRARHTMDDDDEELRWAAIERLPTYDRVRKGILKQVSSNGRVVQNEVDVTQLGSQDKKQLTESILQVVEQDNKSSNEAQE
ncbi:hypothetical protein GH714_015741 [Hevea brasiliensis]|uniref:Uncharacterized protein n=1 Tax=Hevea brasiliensis TaxID=3981 RepID=A0A6A6LMC1_HEVBR|nr:hypothetical protein GH714_015741 [Hevea brasiliensis]